jgi:hypothetical protein
MSGFREWFRRVWGAPEPGTTLVVVRRPAELPPRAPRELPAPPRPPRQPSRGLSGYYGRSLLPDPGRPEPLGRTGRVHDKALQRDSFSPWRQQR